MLKGVWPWRRRRKRDTQLPARAASEYGYSAAFLAVSVLCLIALIVMIRLIRKTPDLAPPTESATAETAA